MELPLTPHGMVTTLAVVRAIRKTPIKTLAQRVGASWQDVRDWERGEAAIPSTAMLKRLALALAWDWQDLALPPLDPDVAWNKVLEAKRRIAGAVEDKTPVANE